MWGRIKWGFLMRKANGKKCYSCLFCKHYNRCVTDNKYLFEKGGT